MSNIILTIGPSVMGHIHVPKKTQTLCKNKTEIVPEKMIIFMDGGNEDPNKADRAKIIFKNDSIRHELMLSLFVNPPSVSDLMKVVPYSIQHSPRPKNEVSQFGRRIAAYANQ